MQMISAKPNDHDSKASYFSSSSSSLLPFSSLSPPPSLSQHTAGSGDICSTTGLFCLPKWNVLLLGLHLPTMKAQPNAASAIHNVMNAMDLPMMSASTVQIYTCHWVCWLLYHAKMLHQTIDCCVLTSARLILYNLVWNVSVEMVPS